MRFASNKQSALLNQQKSENDCNNISCTHISNSVFKYKVGTFHHTLQPLEGVAFDVKRLCIIVCHLRTQNRKSQNCVDFFLFHYVQ